MKFIICIFLASKLRRMVRGHFAMLIKTGAPVITTLVILYMFELALINPLTPGSET